MKNLKSYHILSVLVMGGIVFAAVSFNNHPLFENIDDFVLFAQDEVSLEQGVQISSGDLGSNKIIDINKDPIINGNLFSDEITLDKDVVINGGASFNRLKIKKETQILGSTATPVSLPIAKLPEITNFQVGKEDLFFEGQNNTLSPGSFDKITLAKDSRLILVGGVYNISRLFLEENSTVIFSAAVTLNIKKEFKGQQSLSILPSQNLQPQDLAINYQSEKPFIVGKNSFLNFKLLAPEADVHTGEATTLRGQIAAKKIWVGKNSILSREDSFEKESDPSKVVEDEGMKFIVNEIVVLFEDGATMADAQAVANLVNGRITGFVPEPVIYKIEVGITTASELFNLIEIIKNSQNPLIIEVIPNLVGEPII